jgi:hypothetical protein
MGLPAFLAASNHAAFASSTSYKAFSGIVPNAEQCCKSEYRRNYYRPLDFGSANCLLQHCDTCHLNLYINRAIMKTTYYGLEKEMKSPYP